LGDVDLADSLEPFLSFFLFLEEFHFASNIAAVEADCDVFAHGRNCLASYNLAADCRLDGNLKLLARDKGFEFLGKAPAFGFGYSPMHDHRQSVYSFSGNQDIELHQIIHTRVEVFIIKRGIARGDTLKFIIKIDDDVGQRHFGSHKHTIIGKIIHVLIDATPAGDELENSPYIRLRYKDFYGNPWLFDTFDDG
jgi:hypothetical protein